MTFIKIFYIALSLGLVLFLSVAGQAQANSETDALLKESEADFPGCTNVVRNQLLLFPPEQHVAVMPHLLDSCMAGRAIGEKRTRKMYDIPQSEKPKKKSGFKIQVLPPASLDKKPFEVEYK